MAFFPTLGVQDFQNIGVIAYNAQAAIPANTGPFSSQGAFLKASGELALQLEQQQLYLNAIARMATCKGADCDSFALPFCIVRDGSVASSGPLLFTTPSPVSGSPLIVPVNGVVQTPGGLQFVVQPDTSNPNYSPTDNGYPIAVGQTTTTLTVECLTGGTIGKVAANQITQIFGGLPGSGVVMPAGSVTNTVPFTNGSDPESDDAFKYRFMVTVSSGRVATRNAIAAAILAVQTNITYTLGDQLDVTGAFKTGYFSVFVNSLGQNQPPTSALLSAVYAAVDGVRSAGIGFTPDPTTRKVQAPTLIQVGVSAVVTLAPGAIWGVVLPAMQRAYDTFVNNIGIDPQGNPTTCAYGQIYAILYGVAGVAKVDYLLLNGAATDVLAAYGHQLVASTTEPDFTLAS